MAPAASLSEAAELPEDPYLRQAAMREMLGLGVGAREGSGRPSSTAAGPSAQMPLDARSTPTTKEEPEERRRSKLRPWKKSKRKGEEAEHSAPPPVAATPWPNATVPQTVAATPTLGYQVTAPPAHNGLGHGSPSGDGPSLGRPGGMFLACSRCGQPSPGGGLCEACEDALSQLRQLTAALFESGE